MQRRQQCARTERQLPIGRRPQRFKVHRNELPPQFSVLGLPAHADLRLAKAIWRERTQPSVAAVGVLVGHWFHAHGGKLPNLVWY